MTTLFKRSSTTLFLAGGAAIIFGIFTMAKPFSAAVTLVMIWGAYALIDGIAALVGTFTHGPRSGFVVVIGIISVLAGLTALFHPFAGLATFTWIIGFWLVVRGVMEVMAGIRGDVATSRGLLLVGGALWIIAGIIFMSNPGVGILTVTTWIGILAIIWGIALLGGGFTLRQAAKQTVQ